MDSLLIAALEGQAPTVVHLVTVTLSGATVRWLDTGLEVVWDSNTYAREDATYGYLWIAEHHPNCEYWAIDAFECKRYGEINPAKTTPEPHVASDFGNVVQC